MAAKEISYCILNIAANPHPNGVYWRLFDACYGKKVKYWGDHFATISRPSRVRDDVFQGRLACWVQVNTDEPAVLIDTLDEIQFNDLNIEMPSNIGFNSKFFLYTFRERDHKLFVEINNESGKSISPKLVEKIFSRLLAEIEKLPGQPIVEVTLVPEEDALERVFSVPHIKHLRIHIVRPNADDEFEAAEQVLREMEEQNIRTQDINMSAAPGGGGIDANEETREKAAVAEHNGFVSSDGTLSDGEPVFRSTKWYPRILRSIVGEDESFVQRAIRIAQETVVRIRRG